MDGYIDEISNWKNYALFESSAFLSLTLFILETPHWLICLNYIF